MNTRLKDIECDINGSDICYNNNPNLKKAHTTLALTSEHLDALSKCSKDVLYFGNNYVYVDTLRGKEKIKLRDYQETSIKTFQKHNFVIKLMPRQVGKCVDENTIIKVKYKKKVFKITIGKYNKISKSSSAAQDQYVKYRTALKSYLKRYTISIKVLNN